MGEVGERVGEKGLEVALLASEGCGIGLAISVLDSRGQHELKDAEPSTQGRRKQSDSGSRHFVAIGEGKANMFMRRLLPVLSAEGPSFLLRTQDFPATSSAWWSSHACHILELTSGGVSEGGGTL